jgi:Family of unknown function (DUF6152)
MARVDLRVYPLSAVLAFVLHGGAAWAHHSFAMFDPSKPLTLTGTIKELQWTAPHVLIWFIEDPKDAETAGSLWTIELASSPGPLSRLGWSKSSVVPGDRVIVEINPLRSGESSGQFKKLTIIATGRVLSTAAPDVPSAAGPAAAPAGAAITPK